MVHFDMGRALLFELLTSLCSTGIHRLCNRFLLRRHHRRHRRIPDGHRKWHCSRTCSGFFFSLQVISLMLLNNRSVNPSLDASNILSVVDSAEEVEAEWSGGGGRYVDM